MESSKNILMGMTPDELKAAVKELGMPAFTGGQIAKWLYDKHVMSIDEMTEDDYMRDYYDRYEG